MRISITCNDPPLPKELVDKLESLGKVHIFNVHKLTEDEIVEKMPDTEILICDTPSLIQIGKKTFDGLKKLKFISIFGVGYEWIDVEEAKKRNIIISSTRGGNSQSAAEHIWGMILNLSKRISELERITRKTGENNINNYQGIEVFGKTIGIIGLGEIGKRVSRIAKGFNMKVIGINKSGKSVDGITIVHSKYLLMNSDIIVLSIPLNSNTINFIGEEELNIMKKSVILVNCAREKLVDKKAILNAISKKRIYGYGIETEIFDIIPPSDEYFKYSNVLLTPHNAWNTKESDKNSFSIILRNVEAYLNKKPINIVESNKCRFSNNGKY